MVTSLALASVFFRRRAWLWTRTECLKRTSKRGRDKSRLVDTLPFRVLCESSVTSSAPGLN